MRASAILLSLLLPIALSQVIEGGWTAFGDSYAAGIGAGSKHASDTGDCRRRVNAYPNQIQTDGSLAGGSNVQFSFQACSSAKIAEVQSQITKFRDGPEQLRGFATISIGGNDAGFSEVIEACLVRAKFGSPSCDSVIEAKTERVKSTDMRQNLEDAYRAILDAAKAPGKLITSFRLVVTGYARFFNEETTDCNNRHISFWGLLEPNKQYLTVERRKALNKLVSDMNEVVKAAAEKVSRESEFGQVVFVPIDELFEGHRFCEPDVKEPDNKNPNSWFFLLQGRDAAPDGSLLPPSYPDEPVNLTPSECEALLNGTTPPLGDGWGEFMLCSAQQGTAEGKQLADWITDDTDGNLSGGINIPEAWGKAFHPKSIGHARIRQAIINRLNSRGANHKRVVIMHDGTLEEFEAMINHPLNSRLDAQRIEQPGINIRGYAVWIEADAARKIRDTVTGVVGVLFERADELPPAWPVVPWTTQDAAGVANATERRDGTLQKRIPSPATTTDLDFERHLYPLGDNVDIWHLGVLSQPPALPDLRLLDFRRGYLHDPKGGSGVNIYVLDSGANLDHHEISSRLRTDGLPSYVTRASKLGVIDDASGHGTCMASLIGGKKYGVTKTGNNIIPVRWELGSQTGSPKGASLFEGLLWILFDVKQHNKQGKAVLNYSGGTPIASWADEDDLDNADPPDSPIYLKYDPWRWFLPYFKREDVVVVCAAGNTASAPEDWWVEFPRRHAHQGFIGEDSLIVVGGTNPEGKIWREERGGGTNRYFSLITAYAPGSDMTCARHGSDLDAIQRQKGTSLSTAIVSGVIATFLDRADLQAELQVPGSVAVRVKSFVKEAAQYHTDQALIDPEAGTPLNVLGTHNYVPCDTPSTPPPGGQFPSTGNTFPVRRGDVFYNPGAIATCIGGDTNPAGGIVGDVPGWKYTGCYVDADSRTLNGATTSANDMTPTQCAAFCDVRGLTVFGVENGNECWCDSTSPDSTLEAAEGDCTALCTGDDTLLCGGFWRLTVYKKRELEVQQVEGWEYSNCYVDADARLLPVGKGASAQMTPLMCAQQCCGYRLFGVENGEECWCGDSLDTSKQTRAGECSTPCTGDGDVQCGGNWRINVYADLPGDAPGCTATGSISMSTTLSTSTVSCTSCPCAGGGLEKRACTATASASTSITRSSSAISTFPQGPTSTTTTAMPPSTVTTSTTRQTTLTTTTVPPQPPTTTTSRTTTSSTPPSCPASIACDADNCAGTFDQGGVRATCKGSFPGCVCRPTASTCGNPASCDAGGCAGSFDGNGQATCKGNYATCRCLPQGTQCGTPLSCNLNGCAGTFDANGQATCKGNFAGCRCLPQSEQCGTPLSCNLNGCAGSFDSNGQATCKGNFAGCRCVPQSEQCGTPLSCNLNGCAGTFDSNGQATCKGNFAGCRCLPQSEQCGAPLSCNLNGCAGTFDSNGQATCKGNFAGCRCLPQSEQCGTPVSCNLNGCAGTFDSNGQATCKGNFAGCRCLPQSEQCGTPLSCNLNGCAGTFNSDGVATCKGNFAGCRCLPQAEQCGNQASCDAGGCAGTFDADGFATCKGRYATCRCNPTTNTCGNPLSCDLNGCAGTFNSDTGRATCKGRFATCPCIATTAMCGARQSCDGNNCAGRFTGNDPYGHCTNWWQPCECNATPNTCGERRSCDLNGCNGSFDINSLQPYCRGNFRGCACLPTDRTCGTRQQCSTNGCAGTRDSDGVWRCKQNYGGCRCFVNKFWAHGGGPLGITAIPNLSMYGNDNECTNVPSDWNDRIYQIGLQDNYNCQFFQDINCAGGSVFYNARGVHNLPGNLGGQVSSFKCWRSDGNNNSPSANG